MFTAGNPAYAFFINDNAHGELGPIVSWDTVGEVEEVRELIQSPKNREHPVIPGQRAPFYLLTKPSLHPVAITALVPEDE